MYIFLKVHFRGKISANVKAWRCWGIIERQTNQVQKGQT